MRPGLWSLLGVTGALLACTTAKVPGDEVLGTFALTAVPSSADTDCFLDGGSPIDFEVTLSRNVDGSAAWMTLAGVSRDASWNGTVFTSTASAPRAFTTDAGTCTSHVVETIELALLSRSQAQSLGSVCPPNPLDGGVPAPDPDAGISGPGLTEYGIDAVLACGTLVATLEVDDGGAPPGIEPDGGCRCHQCSVSFDVAGPRR